MQPPLFWASWGYKFPFLPKEAHVGDKVPKALQSILNFLKKGPPKTYGAVEAQRFCLVMGLTLRNIMALQFLEPDEEWPARLPPYMASSLLTFDLLQVLHEVCESAFGQPESAVGTNSAHAPMEPVASS